MTTDRTSNPVSSQAPRGLQRRKPAPLALEARIMFDGAAVATGAEAVKPVAAEAPVAHVAELGSVVAASQAESRSTAPSTADAAKPADTSKTATEAVKPAAAERASDGLANSATKVLFVDSRVQDYQQIVAAAGADVKVVILDADHDGVKQIADALEGMHDVASISIVSHGDSGLLLLGNTALHAGDMSQYQAELGKIGSAMQADGEILLYGCDVGAGSKGQGFIQNLADATGAVVAASTDATGDVAHGGNWDLEIATGALSSAPVLDVSKLADYDHSLLTIGVSNLADLKAALANAVTDGVDDLITLTGDITFTSAADTLTFAVTDGHKTSIIGAGHTISGANLAQVLHINAGNGSVELDNLTITNGLVSGNGGDSLDQSDAASAAANKGGDALGGGIYNAGKLSIVNSTISDNKAAAGGGGGGHLNGTIGGAGGGGGGYNGVGSGAGGTMVAIQNGVLTPSANQGAGGTGVGGAGGSLYRDGQSGGAGGSTVGGIADVPQNVSPNYNYTYIAGGGNGGSASLGGSAMIGGGAGGAGYNGIGAAGGNAAGAIYNVGTLVITNSFITGNLAAAGGGGGSGKGQAVFYGANNAGAAGNGGNAYGGIWNNGGILKMDATSTANMNNAAGAGKGGEGTGTGNSAGLDGTAVSNASIAGSDFAYVAPVLSGAASNQPVNDNATVSPFSGVTLTGSTATLTITLDSASRGAFTTASLSASGFTTSDGGLTYVHSSASASDLQTAVRSLVYQPAANRVAAGATESTTFTIKMDDGVATTSSTASVVATSINDAPSGMGNTSIPVVMEDATSPAGVAISALTGINFSDADTGSALGGIAVTGNTANSATEGVWQYSVDSGAHWYAIGTVSSGSSLLLSASSQVRFIPAADFNGTPTALTVRAVDNTHTGYSTSGATEVRVTADTGTNGGSTAYASATNTISTSITAVNDAPTFTKGPDQTSNEDAGPQTVNGWASNLVKGPADESSQTLSFNVTNSNNALFSTQPSIDANGNLVYTAAPNANGVATVTVTLRDSGGTANGGVDTSTQTFTITITPVNDAPTGPPTLSGSSTEGQALSANTSSIADVDGLVGVNFNHQWQVSADGTTNWIDISGATAATFTLGAAQVGQYVRDKVSFTDQGGTLETLFSAASAAVAGVVPQIDSISRAGSAAVSGSATSVTYNVTFNTSVTGVDAGDFVLSTTGTAAGSIASVTGSGNTYQVTVSGLSGDGTLRLDLKNSGTGILSGNSTAIAGGFTAGQLYTLDHTPPTVSAVSVPNSPLKVGDTQTVTITVADDGGSPLTLVSGTVGGYTLSNLVRLSNTTYTADFMVTPGGADFAAANDLPVSVVLSDAAGNRNTAFTSLISQANDSINGNAPTLLSLSNASVQITSGPNALVGVLSTTDASLGDTFTYALVSGAGGADNAAFSLVNGNTLRVNDPATLGDGARSVRIRTTDSGGNSIEQVFTITISSYSAPVAANDTAIAVEAGGVANASAGVNPLGNVLDNDLSSNTKGVTAISGGTLGTASAGTYGSLTLNADGNYTYTLNNSNAAVQALRTNADTLTDTFTYTMADNTGATSSATLTVTIRGANDAPRVATALSTQQVIIDTPLLYKIPVGTFTDVDAGDILTYTATLVGGAPLPAWLTFNSATGTFSGMPTTAGSVSIVVTATDLSAASASSTFTLQVNAAAVVPVTPVTPTVPTTPTTPTAPITPVVPVQVPDPQVPNNPLPPFNAAQALALPIVSQTVSQTINAPDWSANQMIGDASTLHPTGGLGGSVVIGTGASFSSSNGLFSPVNERYSPLSPTPFSEFERTRTDGGPGIFSVDISPNAHAGLTVFHAMDDQTFVPGERLSFRVPADAFGHSDPHPGIVLKATLADGRALPGWLTFNSTTGQFEGTPPLGFKGELVLKVIARDSSGHQAEVTFRINQKSAESSADVPRGRSGLSEQLRSAASRTALWASGRT